MKNTGADGHFAEDFSKVSKNHSLIMISHIITFPIHPIALSLVVFSTSPDSSQGQSLSLVISNRP